METRMREAAANLEFEEAARLRDEIKRLREVELAVADDPLARQAYVEERAGKAARGGDRGNTRQKRADPMSRPHKPSLDEMGPHSERVARPKNARKV
jgi:excinuclease ABC subunit B